MEKFLLKKKEKKGEISTGGKNELLVVKLTLGKIRGGVEGGRTYVSESPVT
jgi:hypothetical protein